MFSLLAFVFLLHLAIGVDMSYAGEKQLTIEWEQDSTDLPENSGNLDHWVLYSSQDPNLAFDQWVNEGMINYDPQVGLTHDFVITVPDGVETSYWFKMTAVSDSGIVSDPSDVQEGAPTVIDFKAPVAPVLSANYNNQTKTVTLTWTLDEGDTDIASVKVYKSSIAGGPYEDIGNQTSPYDYQIQASDSGKWLYFVVVAFDNNNNYSQNSNEAAVKLAMGVPFNLRVTVISQ